MTFDETEVELRVGEAVWIGQYRVTLVEIDGADAVVQVEEATAEQPPANLSRPR